MKIKSAKVFDENLFYFLITIETKAKIQLIFLGVYYLKS